MMGFFAIVKLTCRSAVRSNIFRTLLFFLVLSSILIPGTIQGDGTATGFLQLLLEYSLGFVTLILCSSAAWLSCAELCNDVETGQIHMIAVKPIDRVQVLFGKISGVILMHLVLFSISAVVIYAIVMFRFENQEFSEEERERANTEILAARQRFKPMLPDPDQEAEAELARRVEQTIAEGNTVSNTFTGQDRRSMLDSVKKELSAKRGEVAFGDNISWSYEGIPEESNGPIFVRYKVFSGSASNQNQTQTRGAWGFRADRPIVGQSADGGSSAAPAASTEYVSDILVMNPQELLTSSTTYFPLPEVGKELLPGVRIVRDGTAEIVFTNLDQGRGSLNFQVADGPYLLLNAGTFLGNYIRAVFVAMLAMIVITMIASAFAAFMSLPTAVFISVSYLLISSFAVYVAGSFVQLEGLPLSGYEKFGKNFSEFFSFLLVPLQDFFVADRLAAGELIDAPLIGKLVLHNLLFRALPLLLLGTWLYRRRELGTAMKR